MDLKKYMNIKEFLKEKPELFLASSIYGSLIMVIWIVGMSWENGQLMYVIAPLILVSCYAIFRKLGQWQNEEKEQAKIEMLNIEPKEAISEVKQ